MAHMIKWKYRECKPGVKNHNMSGYIKYIEEQVVNRREHSGVFEGMDILGMNDEEILNERIENSKSEEEYQQNLYLKYIHERKGSTGMFSSVGADVKELSKMLEAHEGAVWIPIVSLKEDEAKEYKLDTEAAWMDKGRELAEQYRKVLGISEENFKWVAAFHTKAPADQNPFTDAGCQPHIHFMIWEDTPIRTKYKLNDTEMERVHQLTASTLSKEYMKSKYNARNFYENKLKEQALDGMEKYSNEVQTLMNDIKIITGGKGKLSVRELEKREEICQDIVDAYELKRPLSQAQMFYKQKLGIENVVDAKRLAANYADINERLDTLVDNALDLEGVSDVYQKWINQSIVMRKAHRDTDNYDLLNRDLYELQKEIKNNILREARDSMKENIRISQDLRNSLYDKLENGQFKSNAKLDNIMETATVLAELCKSADIPLPEAQNLQSDLLVRSEKDEYEELVENIVSTVYKDMRIGSFNVTSRDFWNAMRNIQTSVGHYEKNNFYQHTQSPYGVAANTVLSPLAQRVIRDDYGKGAINALINGDNRDLTEDAFNGLIEALVGGESRGRERY